MYEYLLQLDTGGRSRKKHEDPEGMYEEVEDSGRGERVM